MPQPCTVVIFGATGDLTHRKLIPALYNLAADGDLPAATAVVGFARRDKTDEGFRSEMEEATKKFSRQSVRDELWQSFASGLYYHRSEFGDADGYTRLAKRLDEIDAQRGTSGNRLFYLSVAPSEFEGILEHLKAAGLNKAAEGSWARVIVEKPFGTDLPSAQELNGVVARTFHERDTFRIDHYLGKETAQNMMVLRFANAIFEPLWNTRFVDHVQITASEPLGVEGRGPYYESSGALRDMVQNHLLQLLSIVAMEPPHSMDSDSVRDEKLRVLRALKPIDTRDISKIAVRGQYHSGVIKGSSVPAYATEHGVKPQSTTETFVALKAEIENWRWAGVPFFLRTGKRLAERVAEIVVNFRPVPHSALGPTALRPGANRLVIRLQPNESIRLYCLAKQPGEGMNLSSVHLDLAFDQFFKEGQMEAYQRLLLDVINGRLALFVRRDEQEAAWTWVEPILNEWAASNKPPKPYAAGTWGPAAASAMLAQHGTCWLEEEN